MKSIASVAFSLALIGSAQAATIYSNDFESGNTTGITGILISNSPNGDHYLGGLSQGGSSTLTLTGLGAYTNLSLAFDLIGIMSIDGTGSYGPDSFQLIVNTVTLFDETFAQNAGWSQTYGNGGSGLVPGGTGVDVVGRYGYNIGYGLDQTYNLSFTGLGSNISSLAISFIGNTNQPLNDESFGVDNIVVSGDLAPIPLPGGLPLLAGGIGLLGLLRRRKA